MRRLIYSSLDGSGDPELRRNPGGISSATGVVLGRRVQPPAGGCARQGDVLVNDLDFLAFRIGTSAARCSAANGSWARGPLRSRPRRRVLSATVPTVYNDFVNANGTGDRAGPEAARRPVHGDRAVAADGAPQRRRAVHRRGRRRVQLPLQRDRPVPRDRQVDLQRHTSSAAAPRPVRSSSAACAYRWDQWGVGGEARYQSAEALCRRSGFLRQQDRPRRVELHLHHQREVLSAFRRALSFVRSAAKIRTTRQNAVSHRRLPAFVSDADARARMRGLPPLLQQRQLRFHQQRRSAVAAAARQPIDRLHLRRRRERRRLADAGAPVVSGRSHPRVRDRARDLRHTGAPDGVQQRGDH